MKITESRLRRIIRNVINESIDEVMSHDEHLHMSIDKDVMIDHELIKHICRTSRNIYEDITNFLMDEDLALTPGDDVEIIRTIKESDCDYDTKSEAIDAVKYHFSQHVI